ncbi:FliA/WhiG family RNA polymerase sigma factor [Salisediminibacterium halotolerans]|uniref:RNA polymerase sigma factor for flagellar operon FliA n=1 Tax=Salisediminibacterium halotolerans TaxID=517425 RepID=A0A1H9Q6Y0_9BACI|nr:FliA/WhiG family RNA polymerase sigma factor [Salisediminibacterium haloalkalitolerans]SER56182.1 RNA polymerase sigma factor for flagellar operon FliA [Salisediminibacterium haloalkalitolerans]
MSRIELTETLKEDWNAWTAKRDKTAGDRLIEAYLPLVDYHVHRISIHLPKSVQIEDLRSHGLMGLYDALEKFDSSRELKFDTYASFRVRGAIIDGLRQEDWLPRSMRDKAKKIEQAMEAMEQKLGRNVSPQEVAHDLGMTVTDVTATLNESFFAHLLSVDEPTQESESKETYAQTIVDHKTPSPDEHIGKQADYEELAEAIRTLNEKEQLVLSLFYFEEFTLTEIGEVMELSTSRISQIHSKSVFKLQQKLTSSAG